MLNNDASIAVVGAGAIGGVTASLLRQSGWNPEVVCKHQETVDRANTRGFHISGVRGEQHVLLNAVKNISDLSVPKDLPSRYCRLARSSTADAKAWNL